MIFRMIIKTITTKPARTFLTILSIVIGVTSVLLINSVSNAGTKMISDELNSLGIDCISITSQDTDEFLLTNNDINNLSKINGVKDVYGFYSHGGAISTNKTNGNVIFWGLSDPDNHLLSIDLLYGEFINQEDIAKTLPVCVIDKETAINYFGKEDAVGEQLSAYINDYKIDMTVIGISGKSDGILSEVINGFIPEIVYTSSNLIQYLCETNAISQISVTMNEMSDKNIRNGINDIRNTLLKTHSGKKMSIENLTENKNSIIKIISMIKLLLTAIAGISVIVASIGITNIMYISVAERKREIGIKKAIGATNLQIGSEFIIEGIAIAVVGCLVGIIFTLILLYLSNLFLPDFSLKLSIKTVLTSIAISIILGALFSLIPSIKAAIQTPVKCLKNE